MYYDMEESGKRIQQLRVQHGYTQKAFAKTLNIDRSNLSRIESGRRGCSLELLVQLSKLFGVSLDYLILGHDKPNSSAQQRERLGQLIKQLEAFRASL